MSGQNRPIYCYLPCRWHYLTSVAQNHGPLVPNFRKARAPMNRTERFYKIDQMLHERRVVPIEVFLEVLDVSRAAAFKRDMEYLRDRLHRAHRPGSMRGYRFESIQATGPAQVPGLWFSVVNSTRFWPPTNFWATLSPSCRLTLLPCRRAWPRCWSPRARSAGNHAAGAAAVVCSARWSWFYRYRLALLNLRHIEIDAWNRGRAGQCHAICRRCIHYRDNWCLDSAWCHLRNDLRGFLGGCHSAGKSAARESAQCGGNAVG